MGHSLGNIYRLNSSCHFMVSVTLDLNKVAGGQLKLVSSIHFHIYRPKKTPAKNTQYLFVDCKS